MIVVFAINIAIIVARHNPPRSEMPKVTPSQPVPFSFDRYDDVIGFVVSRTADGLARGLARAIERTGLDLTPREFAILNRLHQHGPLNQTQLADLTYKDKPATSRMLDRLIANGFAKKLASKEDRRAFVVSLTPAGAAARARVVPLTVEMMQAACKGVARRDLLTTVDVLKRMTAQLNDEAR